MNIFTVKSATLLVALSVCGVTSYFLYASLKREDDDDSLPISSKHKRAPYITIEHNVPCDMISALIGRNGSMIRSIEDRSFTRIKFKDRCSSKNGYRTCTIEGKQDACVVAVKLIEDFIKNQPATLSKEISVPQSCVGRILGRCGETVMDISRKSGAAIRVDRDSRYDVERKVLISGTEKEISAAILLIQDIVALFSSTNEELEQTLSKREPRKRFTPPKQLTNAEVERLSPLIGAAVFQTRSADPRNSKQPFRRYTKSGQTHSTFEVYVSGMFDPSLFWIQIVGPKAAQLDQLVDEMTDYYNLETNRSNHVLKDICVGDLVAATFMMDNKWYRAEVLAIEDNSRVKLFYLDYGDFDVVATCDVFELRTDFLQLNFQAIECYLAGIAPKESSWPVEAVDDFEKWTYMAQWKKLSARVLEYTNVDRPTKRTTPSSIPGIALLDTELGIDITEKLVLSGHAVYSQNVDKTSNSITTTGSNSNLSSSEMSCEITSGF